MSFVIFVVVVVFIVCLCFRLNSTQEQEQKMIPLGLMPVSSIQMCIQINIRNEVNIKRSNKLGKSIVAEEIVVKLWNTKSKQYSQNSGDLYFFALLSFQ